MAKYFSPSKISFYDSDVINTALMPSDIVPVSDSEYISLMNEQCNGKVIVAGTDGKPVAQIQNCSTCTCLEHDLVVATAEKIGHVKVDNTTIAVDASGKISTKAHKHNIADVNNLQTELDSRTKTADLVGLVMAYPANGNIPPGFLICNGAAVSRTTYSKLFARIGTIHGTGNGSTTFNLPNYTGLFLRGYQSGLTANIGSWQGEGLPNITGTHGGHTYKYGSFPSSDTNAFTQGTANGGAGKDSNVQGYNAVFDASRSNSIYGRSAHVTPINAAVYWLIKY